VHSVAGESDTAGGGELVVVANRLPAEYDPELGWRTSPGGLVSALEPALQGRSAVWVGWGGRLAEDVGADAGGQIPSDADFSLDEVLLTAEEIAGYYEGFSNGALWPLYHDAIAQPVFHRTEFEMYRSVNDKFARRVAERAERGATVWIHDYQLQLVPAMLRQLRPDLSIGFFLHIPLPPVEIFSRLPWRRQILLGLLGADLIGFQTRQGALNFLRLVARYLALRPGGDRVVVDELSGARTVRVDAFPIGIDCKRYSDLAAQESTQRRAKQIREDLGNPRTLLLGVDRLDYTKGIDVRTRAVGELLQDQDLPVADTVFLQVATPSREGVAEYQRIRDDVELLVSRINGDLGKVGSPPIAYLHQTVDAAELAAMYVAADVMLVTPLRDGMNLVAKEYVACRTESTGALVLSEFTGAAEQLSDAWQVNPYDIDGVKNSIREAARASEDENTRRMTSMRHVVFEQNVQRWVRDFLSSLEEPR
jgi:trehalose 6-phosphate synthase